MEGEDSKSLLKKPNNNLESELEKTVLKLEEIDVNLYRGLHLWKPLNGRGVFGGQVVGQALVAATNTRPEGLHVHSLHCYFLKAGNPDLSIIYHVERTRDGTSFSSRTVKAVQNGVIIFTMIVSFHKSEEIPVSHQFPMPVVTPPKELMSVDELIQLYLKGDSVSEKQRNYLTRLLARDIPVETKPVDPLNYLNIRYRKNPNIHAPAKMNMWIRVKEKIGESDHNLHRCVAAYISDYALLSTALLPYPEFHVKMIASLDHNMWFHTNFRVDDWMLYECESPRLINGRALVLGRLWKEDGTLAVSVAQEGVIRGNISELKPKL